MDSGPINDVAEDIQDIRSSSIALQPYNSGNKEWYSLLADCLCSCCLFVACCSVGSTEMVRS
jgi:hypothetical protein